MRITNAQCLGKITPKRKPKDKLVKVPICGTVGYDTKKPTRRKHTKKRGIKLDISKIQALLANEDPLKISLAVGISPTTIYEIERGQTRVMPKTLEKLNKYFNDTLQDKNSIIFPSLKTNYRPPSDMAHLVEQAIKDHQAKIAILEKKIKNLEAILQNL